MGLFSKRFGFKDGLSLVAGSDKELLTLTQISVRLHFFFKLLLRGTCRGYKRTEGQI